MNVVSGSLSAVVVDDESLARRGLRLRLDELGGVEVVGECSNGREAVATIREAEPDIVFLDIQMPGMNGFDVVRELQSDSMPQVVFVTAFDHYAVEAFEVHAVDYLLKPVEPERLLAAVEKAREQLAGQQAEARKGQLLQLVMSLTGQSEGVVEQMAKEGRPLYPDRLTIKDGDEVTILPVADITWIDAAGDYMCLHANGHTHVMRITMKSLEEQLDPDVFQRVHRSTIVNLRRIVTLISHINGEYFLNLDCGARLKTSRTYREALRHLLN
jgi:two-component system LytT family response regulator